MTAVLGDLPALFQAESVNILRGLSNATNAMRESDNQYIDMPAAHRGLSFFLDGMSMIDAIKCIGKFFEKLQNVYSLANNRAFFRDGMSAVHQMTIEGSLAVGETLYSLLFLHEIEAIQLASDQISYIKIIAGFSEAYAFANHVGESGMGLCSTKDVNSSGDPISKEVQNWTFRHNVIKFVKNVSLYALSLITAFSALWAVSVSSSVALVISTVAVSAAITAFFVQKSLERAQVADLATRVVLLKN